MRVIYAKIIKVLPILFAWLIFSFSAVGQQNVPFNKNINWDLKQIADDVWSYVPDQVEFEFDGRQISSCNFKIPVPSGSEKAFIQIDSIQSKFVPAIDQFNPTLNSYNENSPISFSIANAGSNSYLLIQFNPYLSILPNGDIELISGISFHYSVNPVYKSSENLFQSPTTSVLAQGYWVKIAIEKDGIYKINADELQSMGFNDPSAVRIFGNEGGLLSLNNSDPWWDDLKEVAVEHSNNQLIFYAKGPLRFNYDEDNHFFSPIHHLYSTKAYYYLSADAGEGKTINNAVLATAPYNYQSYDFDDVFYYEPEDTNLIKSGREWYGDEFNVLEYRNYQVSFPNLNTSEAIHYKINALARSTAASSFYLFADDNEIGSLSNIQKVTIGDNNTFAYQKSLSDSFLISNDQFNLKLQYIKPNSEAKGWLDYIVLNARRKLIFDGGQMHFRDQKSIGPGNVCRFNLNTTKNNASIWDVTDLLNPSKIQATYANSNFQFNLASDSLREFIVFEPGSEYSVEWIGQVENQNIHGQATPEMIIVCPERFMDQANELADFHRTRDFMDVLVVSNTQVFNEFSAGMPDVSAFRNMLRMFYYRTPVPGNKLKYFLLFGDGAYNNKDPEFNIDLLMTFQSSNSLNPISSICTDDFYGYMDSNEGDYFGLLDLGIGRIPVNTVEQAENAVAKIKHYYDQKSYGDWRNVITFLGDDPDTQNSNVHTELAEQISSYIETNYPVYNLDKIYLDAFPQQTTASGERYPDAEISLNNRVNKGSLIFNYTGHGNEIGLSHERVLTIDDIMGWENYDRMPFFVTATCEFNRFDDYGRTSGGEFTFLNNQGGGIALLTTTRSVFYSSLNENFFITALELDNGESKRIGDIMRTTKNLSGDASSINTKKFILVGDPAMRLSFPEYHVVTDSINGVVASEQSDTLRALSYVTISGHISDLQGNVMNNFNGLVYPTIFDKQKTFYTLGNEGNEPFPYHSQNNIIYKGKASVENGYFSFRFIVPKDISYDFGPGKISYYANYEFEDANGLNRQFIIGGASQGDYTDLEGPVIDLFLNDTNFKSGGISNEDPVLIAYLHDKSGINTVGNGIGHDITATLDGNSNTTLVLNDYYEADINSYQSGILSYPLHNLAPGEHELKLKVWDICNNSSFATINFTVLESSEPVIHEIQNYPNPFSSQTEFYFTHNQAAQNLNLELNIYDLSGRLIKSLGGEFYSEGFRVGPIVWDGTAANGSVLENGLYFYRLILTNEQGDKIQKTARLVLMK